MIHQPLFAFFIDLKNGDFSMKKNLILNNLFCYKIRFSKIGIMVF